MKRVLAALLALASLLVACGDDEERADQGNATEATETTKPTPTSPVPLVLASQEGVVVIPDAHEAIRVSTAPAAAAYGIATDLVVFQSAQQRQNTYPPSPDGPVRVWSDGKVRDLAAHPDATRTELLDARLVDGVPVALIVERFGEVGPDDAFEELVRVDLRDDSRTTIVRRPAWESAHAAARFLPPLGVPRTPRPVVPGS